MSDHVDVSYVPTEGEPTATLTITGPDDVVYALTGVCRTILGELSISSTRLEGDGAIIPAE